MGEDSKRIELRGALWMTVDGENLGGPGRMELLDRIGECGSITQAARKMAMSYKAAWDAIDAMNTLAGEPLVERLTGGRGGGGTRLTRRGEQLVANFRRIEREHRRFVDELSRQSERIADDLLLIRRMGMRTSARNQFFGRVVRILTGAVNDEVELELPGGQRLVAIITRESTASLGLEVGSEAFLLVDATSIVLVRDSGGAKFSARNRLPGKVVRVTRGAVNDQVTIRLDGPGESVIVAIVSRESSQNLALAGEAPVEALFKASSVILGVAA